MRNIDTKRLGLLERKREMLRARQVRDAALDEEIAALSGRVAAYHHTPSPVTPAETGLISIMERTDDGRRVPVSL